MKKDSNPTPSTPLERAVESALCERWTMKNVPQDVRNMVARAIKEVGGTKKSITMACLRQGLAKYSRKRDAAAQDGNVQ
jgi:hypothetical protein